MENAPIPDPTSTTEDALSQWYSYRTVSVPAISVTPYPCYTPRVADTRTKSSKLVTSIEVHPSVLMFIGSKSVWRGWGQKSALLAISKFEGVTRTWQSRMSICEGGELRLGNDEDCYAYRAVVQRSNVEVLTTDVIEAFRDRLATCWEPIFGMLTPGSSHVCLF
jgi:hypothetical protein